MCVCQSMTVLLPIGTVARSELRSDEGFDTDWNSHTLILDRILHTQKAAEQLRSVIGFRSIHYHASSSKCLL